MNDDTVHADPQLEERLAPPVRWQVPAIGVAVVFLLASILVVYGRTTWSMVSIWERSETFAHGFVVLPIFLYLLWRDRERLASITPRPYPPALVGIAAAGAAWYVGERLNIVSIPQFAMMAMVPFAVWAVLGTQTVRATLFPLSFLFFAVPFGEFLLPPMMNWTADFAALAVRASGVPVFREGNFLTIPSGTWSIVEACSGLRYLIASFMVGCLFAYLSYRSPMRRAAFVAASLAVPLVANWVRAYIIIMVGHLTNNRLAVGADHLIYGWVFFGLVMLLLFWIGAKWREDGQPQVVSEHPLPTSGPLLRNRPVWIALVGALAVTAAWPLLESRSDEDSKQSAAPVLGPISGRDGWVETAEPLSSWRPDLSGAHTELAQTFAKDRSVVELFIAFYDNSSVDAKAITSRNQLVRSDNKRWRHATLEVTSTATIDGRPFDVRSSVITNDRERFAVWRWFWVDGHVTSSEYVAKLYEALAMLRGHGDPVAWVVVFTPTERDEPEVRTTLQAFATAMREPIEAVLRKAARTP